jgi:hypothetical protein
MTGENYTKAGVLAGKAVSINANTVGGIGARGSERVSWTLSAIILGMRTSAWYSRLVDVVAGINLQPEISLWP